MVLWIIAYGIIQAATPMITGYTKGDTPDGNTAVFLGYVFTYLTCN